MLDSASGLPIANAKIYDSDWPFTGNFQFPLLDSTDVTGKYVRKVSWYVGDLYHDGTTQSSKPGDSTDVYISAYATSSCRYLKFKGAILIENDTITLPNIYLKPYAYISTHLQDTVPYNSGIYVYWYHVIGPSPIVYHGSDTIIYHRVCPGIEAEISWGLTNQFVTVNMGDTAFVNVFY